MKKIELNQKQKKKANTYLALAETELEAAYVLVKNELYRESIFHLYFSCFYISTALLANTLTTKPSHKNVDAQLHRKYGKDKAFPRKYIDLHSKMHEERNDFNYNTSINPPKTLIIKQLEITNDYYRFARRCVPGITYHDLLNDLYSQNESIITEFSFDYYCPKTYANHTRFTLWIPPFYNNVFNLKTLANSLNETISKLKIKNHDNYVLGINSRVNQYYEGQLLLLDFDSFDSDVESELNKIGGVLFKTGRGYHFIGNKVIPTQQKWLSTMNVLSKRKKLSGKIDQNHIDISLLRGYSTLRITSSPVKPIEPIFFKDLW